VAYSGGLAGEVVAFWDAGRGPGRLRVQFGRVVQVSGAFVQVGGHRGVTRQAWIQVSQRRQARLRPVGLPDGYRTVEPDDRAAGAEQQLGSARKGRTSSHS
jgi:hypothetical protein